jgi:hypothetical protein
MTILMLRGYANGKDRIALSDLFWLSNYLWEVIVETWSGLTSRSPKLTKTTIMKIQSIARSLVLCSTIANIDRFR